MLPKILWIIDVVDVLHRSIQGCWRWRHCHLRQGHGWPKCQLGWTWAAINVDLGLSPNSSNSDFVGSAWVPQTLFFKARNGQLGAPLLNIFSHQVLIHMWRFWHLFVYQNVLRERERYIYIFTSRQIIEIDVETDIYINIDAHMYVYIYM